mmetsp:Transcript_15356/g.27015  ORF Transcript_15356/g.27015 Transcript_15356/m.27015 type:complete len:139 (-) Transcript_15356:1666-2082(-)
MILRPILPPPSIQFSSFIGLRLGGHIRPARLLTQFPLVPFSSYLSSRGIFTKLSWVTAAESGAAKVDKPLPRLGQQRIPLGQTLILSFQGPFLRVHIHKTLVCRHLEELHSGAKVDKAVPRLGQQRVRVTIPPDELYV